MAICLRYGMGRSYHVDGQLESDSVYQPFRSAVLSGCGIFVAAFIAYAWCERPMEYVNRTSDREWPSHAKRILLYGPDHEEKNTLLLITHFIGDKQEIAIVEHTADIRHYAAEEDTTIYVYGAKSSLDLQAEPGYKMEKEFNDWLSVYTFNFQ